jgi:hypothetical protein
LKKLPSPSLFGNDVTDTLFTADYQTSNRFHFKVGLEIIAGGSTAPSWEGAEAEGTSFFSAGVSEWDGQANFYLTGKV